MSEDKKPVEDLSQTAPTKVETDNAADEVSDADMDKVSGGKCI